MRTTNEIQAQCRKIQEELHQHDPEMMDYWVGQLGARLWAEGSAPTLWAGIQQAYEMWFCSRILRRHLLGGPTADREGEYIKREQILYRAGEA